MPSAQNNTKLTKQYFLSLSTLRDSQQQLFNKDYQVSDVEPARMKLMINLVRPPSLSNNT